MCPPRAAFHSASVPFSSRASIAAPARSSVATTSNWPHSAAAMSGVLPVCVARSTVALGGARSARTTPMWPCAAALYSGDIPSLRRDMSLQPPRDARRRTTSAQPASFDAMSMGVRSSAVAPSARLSGPFAHAPATRRRFRMHRHWARSASHAQPWKHCTALERRKEHTVRYDARGITSRRRFTATSWMCSIAWTRSDAQSARPPALWRRLFTARRLPCATSALVGASASTNMSKTSSVERPPASSAVAASTSISLTKSQNDAGAVRFCSRGT